jgi:L-lactate dehydrogenase complex protein LldF
VLSNEARGRGNRERLAMAALARVFSKPRRYEAAQRLARVTQSPFLSEDLIRNAPGPLSAWTKFRDLEQIPTQTFREWWRARGSSGAARRDER